MKEKKHSTLWIVLCVLAVLQALQSEAGAAIMASAFIDEETEAQRQEITFEQVWLM